MLRQTHQQQSPPWLVFLKTTPSKGWCFYETVQLKFASRYLVSQNSFATANPPTTIRSTIFPKTNFHFSRYQTVICHFDIMSLCIPKITPNSL
jgi:hypothetical protein